jgi:hypothetical protein
MEAVTQLHPQRVPLLAPPFLTPPRFIHSTHHQRSPAPLLTQTSHTAIRTRRISSSTATKRFPKDFFHC